MASEEDELTTLLLQFGAAGSGVGGGPSGLSFMKERGSIKFAFGGGGSNSNSSMYPPQQQPISSSHQHHEEPQQQQHHHQKRSLLTEPKRKKKNHHQQEDEEVENDQEEEEILIVVERREEHSRGGEGSHRHHQHQQQDEEEQHHGDVESPPLSQPSSRHQDQDQLNSDYVDDEEDDQDRDRRDGGAGDRDTEDEYIQRRSWKQEPEAEAEMDVEQEHQQHEQEHEMEIDNGAGEQGGEDGGSRSGEQEANVQGVEREVRLVPPRSSVRRGCWTRLTRLLSFRSSQSQLPYSKLYLKIAQSDLYAQQHKVFDEKWAAVDADDEEEWVQGGDGSFCSPLPLLYFFWSVTHQSYSSPFESRTRREGERRSGSSQGSCDVGR